MKIPPVSEADRLKLTRAKDDSVPRPSGVKPGHRTRAYHRALARKEPDAIQRQQTAWMANSYLDSLVYQQGPLRLAGLSEWIPDGPVTSYFGLDRSITPERLKDAPKPKVPNLFVRAYRRLRYWALYSPID